MHARHLKVLIASLFVLVGAMAMSASAAQAEWELVGGANGGGGVLTLNLTAEVGTGEILVTPQGESCNKSITRSTSSLSGL